MGDKETAAAYDVLLKRANPYLSDGSDIAADYRGWAIYNTVPYQSATHGGRYVNNYANETAAAYGKFEDFGEMPVATRWMPVPESPIWAPVTIGKPLISPVVEAPPPVHWATFS